VRAMGEHPRAPHSNTVGPFFHPAGLEAESEAEEE